ncbi:MAG: c-type cytochrome, partial [Isosphaeraceae bacterium]
EMFFVNTVNGHLWHLMPGAHLERLHTIDPNPVLYRMIDSIADHYHFDTGKGWAASRDGVANNLGGGHAHQGALIYQGGRWPKSYDGRLLMVNFHGRRLNTERLERLGNGFRASHEKDFALFGDTWFRGLDLAHSPDGNIAVIDWSDTGECHENTGVHRSSGRIYLLQAVDERRMAFQEFQEISVISELQSSNIYYARRALEQFQFEPEKYQGRVAELKLILEKSESQVNRLRALWAMHSLGVLNEMELTRLCRDTNEHVRGWAVRLLVDRNEIDTVLGDRRAVNLPEMKESIIELLVSIAKNEPSGLVRSIMASAIQRMPVRKGRLQLAGVLAEYSQDANDISQPLLVWYGVSAVASAQPVEVAGLLKTSRWLVLNEMIVRRLASEMQSGDATAAMEVVIEWATKQPVAGREVVLKGLAAGLAGRDSVKKPARWDVFVGGMKPDSVAEINEIFGAGATEAKIRAMLADSKADMRSRVIALRTLIRRRPKDLVAICSGLLGTRFLNVEAMNGLSTYEDQSIGESLIRNYRSFALLDRPKVLDVLVSRPSWAKQLLVALGQPERIPGGELSVVQARQILALNQPELTLLLEKNWGRVGTPAAEKQAFRQRIEGELKLAGAKVDLAQGRQLYLKNCGQCHQLYGEGGRIGPDITGAQRQDLGYLLENVLEPSAVVSPDFRVTNLHHVALLVGQ